VFLCLAAFNGIAQKTAGPLSDLQQAETLTKQGKTNEALAILNALSEKPSQPPGFEARIGKTYFQNARFQPAIRHLQLAIDQNPADWESVQLLALSDYSAGDCRQALPLLLRLGPHLPKGDTDNAHLTGVCYLKTGDLDSARTAFATMFSTPPDSAAAHLMLAKMMVREHLEEQSIPEIRKAVEIDPRLPMAHFLLGEIYLYQQSPQQALDEFQKELALNSTVWLVYWRLGDALVRLERYDEAEKILKQSIWLNETFTGSYLLLGEIQLKKGDTELAVGFLNRALKLDPQNYYAHYSLARAFQQMGRTEEANREFEITRTLRAQKKNEEDQFFQGMTR
jgi:tetratricopeptide (TPR) repeat protein